MPVHIYHDLEALCPLEFSDEGSGYELVKRSFGWPNSVQQSPQVPQTTPYPPCIMHASCLERCGLRPFTDQLHPPVQFDWAGMRAIRLDGLRPFTDQLHPLCNSTGQASAPLEQMASAPSQINCTPCAVRLGRQARH